MRRVASLRCWRRSTAYGAARSRGRPGQRAPRCGACLRCAHARVVDRRRRGQPHGGELALRGRRHHTAVVRCAATAERHGARRGRGAEHRGRGDRQGFRPRPRCPCADLGRRADRPRLAGRRGGPGVAGAWLAAGIHHLALAVADRAGNPARLAWDVTPRPARAHLPGVCRRVAGRPRAVERAPLLRLPARRPASARCRYARSRRASGRLASRRDRQTASACRASHRAAAAMRCRDPQAAGAREHPGRCQRARRWRGTRNRAHGRPSWTPARSHRGRPASAAPAGAAATAHGTDRRAGQRPARRAARPRRRARGAHTDGWRRVGQARADSAGRFVLSFAIVHAGQFALRARVAALAAIPSAPFVLTMR